MIVRNSLRLAAVIVAIGIPASARAYDPTPVMPPYGTNPNPYGANPTAYGPVQPAGFCASCGHSKVISDSGCSSCKSCGKATCGTPLIGSHKKGQPFIVNLCPGACFGYFQPQWRKWDEVCPYPYQGTGLSDAARPPSPYLPSINDRMPPVKPENTLTPPRQIDQKTGLPIIPTMPEKSKN